MERRFRFTFSFLHGHGCHRVVTAGHSLDSEVDLFLCLLWLLAFAKFMYAEIT